VAEVLHIALAFSQQIPALKARQACTFRQLQRALGVLPSSERDRPKPASRNDNLEPLQRLQKTLETALGLRDWHRGLARKQNQKAKGVRQKMTLLQAPGPSPHDDEDDGTPLSAEELAEMAREEEACQARLALGGGADPAFAPLAEALMTGETVGVERDTVLCPVEDEDLPKGAVVQQTFSQTRQRIDVTFQVTLLDVEVEKKAVKTLDGSVRLLTGEPETVGPNKMRVTWNFLANLVVLVSLYAMPLHRFARLVSSTFKTFTAAQLWRYYRFVAQHFVPIYNYLGLSLAQAPVLMGDDTSSLVLEVSRHAQAPPSTPPPWKDYATAQASQAAGDDPRLGCQLGRVWGFVSPRKDGKGNKRALNTTVVSGRAVATDPKSTVIFYRSHFGGLGNILEVLLHRRADGSRVVVQADLSTVNLVSAAQQARLKVVLAGCASHARRPFKLHYQDEPELCEMILHQFKGIPIYESSIDLVGRNAENTRAVRDVDQRGCWEAIREYCDIMTLKWSPKTNLGDAARYILRHYDKLTYYLQDPRVAPTNNLSERLLRMEKLIANNSLFRQTLEGRFALDIMRTVLQTAIAAKINLHAYIIWVLRIPAEVVADDPAAFTPQAFATWWNEQQALEALRQTPA
jgi:hypothetical protein